MHEEHDEINHRVEDAWKEQQQLVHGGLLRVVGVGGGKLAREQMTHRAEHRATCCVYEGSNARDATEKGLYGRAPRKWLSPGAVIRLVD